MMYRLQNKNNDLKSLTITFGNLVSLWIDAQEFSKETFAISLFSGR